MTKDQINNEIARVTAERVNYVAAKASYEREIAVSRASYNSCPAVGKKKCQENRQKEINQWQALIDGEVSKIAGADSRLKDLKASLASANQAEVLLAEKGIDQASQLVVAQGQSDAVKKSAEIESAAKAQATLQDAGAASNRKTAITVGVVIGVVLIAAIVGFALSKKLKKNKKQVK